MEIPVGRDGHTRARLYASRPSPTACQSLSPGKMHSCDHPRLMVEVGCVAGVRAHLAVGAGPPSLLYNHLNRSFRWGRGLFDLVEPDSSTIFIRSFIGSPGLLELLANLLDLFRRSFPHRF